MSPLTTLASIATATAVAGLFGPLLGRIATQWFSGRGLSNLLIEIRGAFLPFVVSPIVAQLTGWESWLVVGVVVGFMQGISVARWIARRTGEWSPSLIGGIALGRSRAALLSARATARGAVISTLATTTTQVILLEALLRALSLPGLDLEGSVGATLQQGAGFSGLFLVILGTLCVIGTEAMSSWLLQRHRTNT